MSQKGFNMSIVDAAESYYSNLEFPQSLNEAIEARDWTSVTKQFVEFFKEEIDEFNLNEDQVWRAWQFATRNFEFSSVRGIKTIAVQVIDNLCTRSQLTNRSRITAPAGAFIIPARTPLEEYRPLRQRLQRCELLIANLIDQVRERNDQKLTQVQIEILSDEIEKSDAYINLSKFLIASLGYVNAEIAVNELLTEIVDSTHNGVNVSYVMDKLDTIRRCHRIITT